MPLKLSDVVLGKYFGMLFVLFVPIAVMAAYPLILGNFGNVNLSCAYSALFAFFMLGACLLSIRLFISSITESQVVSAVVTLVAMLFLYFMSGLASWLSFGKCIEH